jgi:hypothetical protein
MSTTFDRKAIMQAAHFTAKWRVATVGGSYREWFANALAAEWKKAKADRARFEQNIGLPVRSCRVDAPAPRAVLGKRYGSVRLFAGPGAYAAAVASFGDNAASTFTRERAAGRRAADFA